MMIIRLKIWHSFVFLFSVVIRRGCFVSGWFPWGEKKKMTLDFTSCDNVVEIWNDYFLNCSAPAPDLQLQVSWRVNYIWFRVQILILAGSWLHSVSNAMFVLRFILLDFIVRYSEIQFPRNDLRWHWKMLYLWWSHGYSHYWEELFRLLWNIWCWAIHPCISNFCKAEIIGGQ